MDKRLKKMFILIIPIMIGVGVNQINTLIDRMMASGLPEGSISALNFADKLSSVVCGIFASAIVTVIFPTLPREGNLEESDRFMDHISNAVNNANLIMIPATVGMMVLRNPIINVLFKHDVFDNRAADMTSTALLYMSIG